MHIKRYLIENKYSLFSQQRVEKSFFVFIVIFVKLRDMEKLTNKKKILFISLAGGMALFLLLLGFSYAAKNSHKELLIENQIDENNTERLDVEIIEKEEGVNEAIENELEEYIEDDISDLEIQEEIPDFVEEEEVVSQPQGGVATLPLVLKTKNPEELRIGFMTDLHAKSNSGNSRAERIIKPIFTERVNHFIEEMNNEFVPDFLLLNGDVIEGTGRDDEIGSGELRSLKKLFDRTQIKKYWVVGNHELRSVNKDRWKEALEIDYLDETIDIDDYRIIILDSNYDEQDRHVAPGGVYTRGNVSSKQINWLKRELQTEKKKIVFMHHPPLWDVNVRSNEGLPLKSLELQKVFSENNVTAVFSGHVEDFFYDKIDEVKYYVLPGVIKNKTYQGTFAEIKIINKEVELDVSYIGSNGKYRKMNIKEVLE